MRHVLPFVFAALLCGLLAPADAASTINGAWGGSGIARYRHRIDRIVCRVHFDQVSQKSFRVSALCSTGNDRYEESGRVTKAGPNRYSGWVLNTRLNQRGSVQMTQHGSRLSVGVSSRRGTANLTLSRR
jgi:hypothetical protein